MTTRRAFLQSAALAAPALLGDVASLPRPKPSNRVSVAIIGCGYQATYGSRNSFRVDPRVWVKENYNARFMKAPDLPKTPSVAVTDVSFISLRLILPPIAEVLAPGGLIVALIKPQFEVGKGNAPGGLVRDDSLRLQARDGIVEFAKKDLGLELLGLAESPIRGREMGNIEYLSLWRSDVAR